MNPVVRDELIRMYGSRGWYHRLALRTKLRYWAVHEFLTCLPKEGTILDLGCGYGLLSNLLALSLGNAVQVLGVDQDRKRIEAARAISGERGNLRFEAADVRSLDIPDCRGAVLVDVLHHIPFPEQDRLLLDLGAKIGEGGILAVSEVDPEFRPRWRYWVSYLADVFFYPFAERCRFRTESEFRRIFEEAGFIVEKVVRNRGSLVAPVVYIGRKQTA